VLSNVKFASQKFETIKKGQNNATTQSSKYYPCEKMRFKYREIVNYWCRKLSNLLEKFKNVT
jgi:hypothetical protein